MGDPSLMMLGGQHHGGIAAKEEKDESDLAFHTTPLSTHDLMSNSAIGLSLHGEGEDEEDLDPSSFNVRDGFNDLPSYDSGKGIPSEIHHEPAIPRLMQMQMEKYLYIHLFTFVLCVVECA
jgi:hypothetical protein